MYGHANRIDGQGKGLGKLPVLLDCCVLTAYSWCMTTSENTQREELAQIITDHVHEGLLSYDACTPHAEIDEAADDILAAGYRKPRTITTVEELDALSDESVVRSDFGVIHEKRVEFDTSRVIWVCPGDTDEHTAGKITLPAIVLHEPEGEVGA